LKANDAILADPEKHMGLYEDLLQNYKAVQIAGGAAQNTARGAAYILEPKSVVYIGCIGKDKYGETLEKISADAGVKSEYLYDEKTPTVAAVWSSPATTAPCALTSLLPTTTSSSI
jgi:adenosine kinase